MGALNDCPQEAHDCRDRGSLYSYRPFAGMSGITLERWLPCWPFLVFRHDWAVNFSGSDKKMEISVEDIATENPEEAW